MSAETKVVLVRAQEHDHEYRQWHEDLRVAYLSSYLRQHGYATQVFDYALQPLITEEQVESAIEAMAQSAASLIVFVMEKAPTNSPFFTAELIRRCRAHTLMDDLPFVIYGNTSVGADRLLHDLPVDFVVLGEEPDCLALLRAVVTGGSPSAVPGIAFCDADGRVVRNTPLPLPVLDELPRPHRYFFEFTEVEKRRCAGYVGGILASRGCYARCSFCYIQAFAETYGGKYPWRGRSPAQVVDEMEHLYREHDVREFAFLDPNFFGPGRSGREWGATLAREIINRDLKGIAFSIYARANDIEPESMRLLKGAGLYAVFIGIESFNQAVLNRYRKGTTVEQNHRAINILKQFGIRLRMGFITFDHFTTFPELEENLSHLKLIMRDRGELITQPIFFYNVVAALEDTPLGRDYAAIGAAVPASTYQGSEVQTKHQLRILRGGAPTRFSDSRIEFLAEVSRILASEILQRTTWIENMLADQLYDPTQCLGPMIGTVAARAWLDGLTRFSVELFGEMVVEVKSSETRDQMLLERLGRAIVASCNQYDQAHLRFVVPRTRDVTQHVFS